MSIMLPSDMHFLERGWLSSNSLLLLGPKDAVLIDSGYHTHAEQTVALVQYALQGRQLSGLLNTHLHSDHCGGNAAIQDNWPEMRTSIPATSADAVSSWNEEKLTYKPTGQFCPRFSFDAVLSPGTRIQAGTRTWEIHAAPGHDPDSILMFQPETGVLLSADALWEHGFGVVFPEIYGESGFDDVSKTLDLIEQLQPQIIVPGHGSVFTDVSGALVRARERLSVFRDTPLKHASHAAKVLIKFHLMAIQGCPQDALLDWSEESGYLRSLHQVHFKQLDMRDWVTGLLEGLVRGGSLGRQDTWIVNV
jgi:glyoxylase-like metal-dependent hydrolase (beta-lactamase superfamily II)